MTTQPERLTDEQLDEIETKAAYLRERLDRKNPWPSDNESHWMAEGWKNGTRNALEKLRPAALVAEVRRLQQRRRFLLDQLAKRDTETGRGDGALREFLGGEPVEEQPTLLRWGLNDVMWGDDDTVTVMLSGPDREPYWLELNQERAAVLRQDLAGPDGEQPADGGDAAQYETGTRPCGHDDYHDAHEWADGPGVWCPGIGYDAAEPAAPVS